MIYTVAVRELCEFTAKQGDLDLRFTPRPRRLKVWRATQWPQHAEAAVTGPRWP